MEIITVAMVEVIAEVEANSNKKPTHKCTNINVEVSDNLDRTQYITKEGVPNKIGAHTMRQCFIQGLIGCIHFEHENGFKDSAENLRYIIAELERGFVAPAKCVIGNFGE